MQRVCFLVTLAILWVVILVAPVAANPTEVGVVLGNGVSRYQVDPSDDGYVPAPGAKTASAKAEARATVYVYTAPPPAPHYNRPHYTAPRPCAKRPAYHAPPRHTYRAPAKPKAKPGKPFLTNKAGGSAFGAAILKSSIAVTSNGVVVKIMKGIMSGKPGSEWQFATPGHTLPISRPIGSLLRFIIAVRNTDSSDLPTDGIYVSDDLVSTMNSKAENGALFMGGTKLRELSADELTQLTSGVKIPIKQYGIDSIPAKGTLGIRYDVRIAGGTGGSKDPTTIVPTDDNPGSTGATGPGWWSKIIDGLKKFNWNWLLWWVPAIPLIFAVMIFWQMSHRPRTNEPASPKPNDPPQQPRRTLFDDPPPANSTDPVVPPDPPITPAWKEDEPALTMEQIEEAARRGTE